MSQTVDIRELNERIESKSSFVNMITMGMDKVIVGQKHLVESLLIGLLSDGHILLEGVPGLAKTLAIKTLSSLIDAKYSRIQFTPDLLPADVIGTMIYSQKSEEFQVKQGPIFANFVLADEINRAPAKVQSALLEAMQEHTVTVGGTGFRLEEPFFVLATENPIEQDGTYVLPEAQCDRFMFKLILAFPSEEELSSIVLLTQKTEKEQAEKAVDREELLRMRQIAKEVLVPKEVLGFAVRLVSGTHPESEGAPRFTQEYIRFGASPRAAQALIGAGKVRALMQGRYNVSAEDTLALAKPVLRHRIKLSFRAVSEKRSVEEIIDRLSEELKKKS